MSIILSSARLVLRELSKNDTDFIIQLVNTPGWLKYIGDRNIRTTEQAAAYLQNGPLKSYAENGFGLCMVVLKDTDTPIGMCGMIKRNHLPVPDIGFAFLPEYHGKGYAQEVVKATIEYAKMQLGLPYILAIVMPENKGSIKVLEKGGLTCRETIPATEKEPLLLLYSNE